MKRVIYIGYQPITEKVISEFYINCCLNNGIEVEYWDISHVYFPKMDFGIPLDLVYVKYIRSFRELKSMLSDIELTSTLFIIHITFGYKVLRLFMLLSMFNCTTAFFGRGMFPFPDKTDIEKIRETIFSFDINRMILGIKDIVARLFKYFKIIKTFDYIFRAGSEGYKTTGSGNQIDKQTSTIIDINYFDYENYAKSIIGVPIIQESYCVFLDEYLPYHPDIAITGIKTVTDVKYYIEINKFFDFIERKYDISVIVAAHPKAIKYKLENPFEGRRIIFNKTCDLVKDALFVMTHHSTSISYPVLFKKPIFFITSLDQKKIMFSLYRLTIHLGEALNCQVIYFDSFDKTQEFKTNVDVEKYDDYKYKYLTSRESENKQSSEIFIEAISQL